MAKVTTKVLESGGFLFTVTDKSGKPFTMRYMDLMKRDALFLFKAEVKAHNNRISQTASL